MVNFRPKKYLVCVCVNTDKGKFAQISRLNIVLFFCGPYLYIDPFQKEEDSRVPEGCSRDSPPDADSVHRHLAAGDRSHFPTGIALHAYKYSSKNLRL